MKIKRTSCVVNMMEESALNYHVVLQWRIIKVTSWMSLKSSEINNYSWNISAVLISPFSSSSCCQACFPTIVRPIKYLWKLTLKIFLFFSRIELLRLLLVVLFESVEEDGLLSSKSRTQKRERRISWFNIIPLSFIQRNDARWIINRLTSLWFCFCLWSGCNNLHLQLWRLFFRQIFRTFCVIVVWMNHKFIWSMRNSDPGLSVVFTQRPNSDFNSVFTIQATGRDF